MAVACDILGTRNEIAAAVITITARDRIIHGVETQYQTISCWLTD